MTEPKCQLGSVSEFKPLKFSKMPVAVLRLQIGYSGPITAARIKAASLLRRVRGEVFKVLRQSAASPAPPDRSSATMCGGPRVARVLGPGFNFRIAFKVDASVVSLSFWRVVATEQARSAIAWDLVDADRRIRIRGKDF